jgi:hypothetical protein
MQNKEYSIYADGVHSGDFKEQRNAVNTGKRFVKFPGVRKVTVCHKGKVVKTIAKMEV